MKAVRRFAAVAAVVLAALGGGLLALATYSTERELSVARIELSVQPFRSGALDMYVPLVDWGVRFDAVRAPARLSIDVRAVDRQAARRVAAGQLPDVKAVRAEARDAVASYLRLLLGVVLACALAGGVLVAFAVRGHGAPRLRWQLGATVATAAVLVATLVLLLPPRGEIADPEYYANGPDIPVALRAIEQAQGSARAISEDLNEQLVGLARLVAESSEGGEAAGARRLVLASDLHNNLLALPALERAAAGAPLLFAGDLTSSGSPFEVSLVRRIVEAGRRFVFVSGNHDSDVLVHRLARAGALVLTERGRLLPSGRLGPLVPRVGGLRVAGYSDPFERRRSERYRALSEPRPTPEQQRSFADWLRPLVGRIDAVLVHSPALVDLAAEELRANPPPEPLAILSGHTHVADLATSENLVELNGGTVGGGGTGNLEKGQPFGLAVLVYEARPRFEPLAADLVEIDPRAGSARAERRRLSGLGRTDGPG